jgi:beta-glucanase (GH16 family)
VAEPHPAAPARHALPAPLVPRRAGLAALTCLLLLACGGGAAPTPAPTAGPPPAPVPAPAPAPPPAPGNAPTGYVLVWSDEFSTDGLPDATRWDYDTERNLAGWFNNERQYYARARPENSVVANGRLRITARLESLSSAADWGGQRYTSARLLTRGRADWTYGFFEVRAKLPCGRGTWPAIWTLGSGGVWPDDGEIDIMEQVGSNPSRVFGTVHTKQSAGPGTGAATQVPDACTAFHDYQLTWTADGIAIGIDGVVYYRYANPRAGAATWPFDAAQFLILNIAIGGDLGGSVDDSIFPVVMEIDHVRVYQAPR